MEEFLKSIFDPSKKILLIDVYETNKIDNLDHGKNTNIKIEMLNSFFDTMTDEKLTALIVGYC